MQAFAWADRTGRARLKHYTEEGQTEHSLQDKSQNDEILWERKIKKSKVFKEIKCL